MGQAAADAMAAARSAPRAPVSLEADVIDAALSIAPLAAEQLLGSLDDPLSLRAGLAKEPDLLRRWAASKGKNPLALEQKHLAKYILAANELLEHLNDSGWAPPSSKSTVAAADFSLSPRCRWLWRSHSRKRRRPSLSQNAVLLPFL